MRVLSKETRKALILVKDFKEHKPLQHEIKSKVTIIRVRYLSRGHEGTQFVLVAIIEMHVAKFLNEGSERIKVGCITYGMQRWA